MTGNIDPETGEIEPQRIRKLKHKPDEGCEIHYEADGDRIVLTSGDAPRPEMDAALQALVSDLCNIMELPASYAKDLAITGIVFSDGGEAGKVMLLALKTLSKAVEAVAVINTPNVPLDELSTDTCIRIDRVVEEARLYLDGERKQMVLPGMEGETASNITQLSPRMRMVNI